MADHQLVEQTITWLGNWDTNNAPQPVFIDRDDSDSASFNNRRVVFDLTEDNAIGVSSSPDRITTPIGTEYDHRVEDGVAVRIEGAHTDEFGQISDAVAFQDIVDEAKRVLLAERGSYPTVNGVDYHTVEARNQSNLAAEWHDYFRYDFDLFFIGYEELP